MRGKPSPYRSRGSRNSPGQALSEKAVGARMCDSYVNDAADVTCFFIEHDRLEPGRAPDTLARIAARLLDQDGNGPPDQAGGELALLAVQQFLQALQPFVLDRFGNL